MKTVQAYCGRLKQKLHAAKYHEDGVTPRGVAMGGITLSGRIYRDTLKKERDDKKLLARLRRQSWAIGGWIAGVATVIIGEGAKAVFEFFFGQ
jgi:hypothetical protein